MLRRLLHVVAPTRGYAILCGTAAGVTLVLFTALVTGAGGPLVAQNTSNAALFAAPLAAAWGCFAKALRPAAGRRVRWSWTLIGLGALSWAVGQTFCIWYETILGTEVPFPSLADAGYFWMMPLTAAGLLLLPVSRQSVAQQARSILDGLMIATSLLLITWNLILGPLARQGADSFLALLVTLWYPGGDVVVLTVVLFTLARLRSGGPRPMSMSLVGIGLATFTVSDSGYAYLTLTDSYGSGAVLDLGWFVGFVLILIAARKPDGPHEVEDADVLTRPLGVMLPYLAVLGALATSTLEVLRHGAHDPVVSWMRSAIILLIVGRQLLTLLENRNLTRDLEHRVVLRGRRRRPVPPPHAGHLAAVGRRDARRVAARARPPGRPVRRAVPVGAEHDRVRGRDGRPHRPRRHPGHGHHRARLERIDPRPRRCGRRPTAAGAGRGAGDRPDQRGGGSGAGRGGPVRAHPPPPPPPRDLSARSERRPRPIITSGG